MRFCSPKFWAREDGLVVAPRYPARIQARLEAAPVGAVLHAGAGAPVPGHRGAARAGTTSAGGESRARMTWW